MRLMPVSMRTVNTRVRHYPPHCVQASLSLDTFYHWSGFPFTTFHSSSGSFRPCSRKYNYTSFHIPCSLIPSEGSDPKTTLTPPATGHNASRVALWRPHCESVILTLHFVCPRHRPTFLFFIHEIAWFVSLTTIIVVVTSPVLVTMMNVGGVRPCRLVTVVRSKLFKCLPA